MTAVLVAIAAIAVIAGASGVAIAARERSDRP